MTISRKTAITGVGVTAFGKLPGRSAWSLQAEAVKRAVDDAGLTKDDVDGLFTEPQFSEPLLLHGHSLGRYLGMKTNYLSSISIGGATAITLVQQAAMAIHSGLCEVAVCVYGENAKTGMPMLFGKAQMGRGQIPAEELAYGMAGGPVMEARSAMRYKTEYKVTDEMFGSVAIAFREHASRNPNAMYRDPLTMEQYLASKMVADPLRVLDCTIGASDGAVALVVTSAARARDLAKPPAYIAGMGAGDNLDWLRDPTHYTHFAGARSSQRAYAMAGVRPEDVDSAQLYDCFTSTVLITIEDYGFCKKGEAGPFALEGNLRLGGKLPSNTSGGMLSEANMTGWNHLAEGARQIRGESTSQVDGCEVVIASGHGGLQAAHATLILTKEAS
ncbi:MAG: thiolase C-terminal domain-containing protein [Actinomycetota bacterium]